MKHLTTASEASNPKSRWVTRVLYAGVTGVLAAGCVETVQGQGTTDVATADLSQDGGAEPSEDTEEAGRDDVASDTDVWVEDGDSVTPPPLGPQTLAAPGACCLGLSPWRAVFRDAEGIAWTDGDAVRRPSEPLADASEPTLAGDTIVVVRGVTPDRTLWLVDPRTGSATEWAIGATDPHHVTADGDRVVWVEGTGVEADLWTARLVLDESPTRLTADDAEQAWPHVSAQRVVWTDLRNDPDKRMLGTAEDPFATSNNNADVYAMDLGGEVEQLTDDPAKQARPAVNGQLVAWLDWRGISPEPKFARFAVWARLGSGPAVELGESSWERPALWQRPAVSADAVFWVRETSAGAALQRQTLDGAVNPLAVGSAPSEAAVAVASGLVAWVTGPSIEVLPLTP